MSNTASIPNNTTPRIILSAGEPAGIGPDIVLALAMEDISANVCVVADINVLQERALKLGLDINFGEYTSHQDLAPHTKGHLQVLHQQCPAQVIAGQLNPANSVFVMECISQASQGCIDGEFDAMVTAPVNKAVINDAGIPFTGHTEFIADLCHTDQPVMMLMNENLRVALVTTHIPVSQISSKIDTHRVTHVIQTVHQELSKKFGISQPSILVCGLNPHAGEGGHLGREELDVIIPALDSLRQTGMSLIGPTPADTAFTAESLANIDAVVCMYHDQGLPVLKSQGFGSIVNLTLGLPIIRTSVDHGTALQLAGTGKASHASLRAALNQAVDLSRHHLGS